MTTIDLYRKHKAGEISREKFLYEVRRDNNLPFITNLTSYDDAVKILKNRGIVTEVDTKEAKAAESVKAEVKPKAVKETKKELNADQVHPYEYRLGLQCELDKLGDYSDESFEKAKATVLKNLNKDFNYYTNELNAKQSSFTFKTPESQDDKFLKKINSDGRMEIKGYKNEKANVKDNLGKKEEGKVKPKGVKVMPDKGVTGSSKTIKEGIEEHHNDPNFPGGPAIHDMLDRIADDWGKDSDLYNELEDTIVGYADNNGNLTNIGKAEVKALLSNYDVLEDYGQFLDKKEPYTGKSDEDFYKDIQQQYQNYQKYNMGEGANDSKKDKLSKIKETLKQGLKQEKLNQKDIELARATGDVVNIPFGDTAGVSAAKSAKINYKTYK